ncbi:MAG: hypothetical protein WD056_00490 [Gemmatimonadota bacterium]
MDGVLRRRLEAGVEVATLSMLLDNRSRNTSRVVWSLILGLFLGGLFTELCERFLPESAGRDFLTTSVAASVGPFHLDLVAVAFTLGPLTLTINVLTLVGIGMVALVARSWI